MNRMFLLLVWMAVTVLSRPLAVRAQPAPSHSATSGSTWAVVVGLDYNWSANNRLQFPLSDARRFQQYLNAPADHTAFLTDAVSASDSSGTVSAGRATRDNILQTIRRIAAKAKPEDTFWFYFSGHGLVPARQ